MTFMSYLHHFGRKIMFHINQIVMFESFFRQRTAPLVMSATSFVRHHLPPATSDVGVT